jgi:hypothetical protein
LQKKKIIFYQDSASAHKSSFTNEKIKQSALRIVGTSTLFPRFGWGFSLNHKAIAAVEGYFADLTKNHYRDGIMALELCWNKCISVKCDYIEK